MYDEIILELKRELSNLRACAQFHRSKINILVEKIAQLEEELSHWRDEMSETYVRIGGIQQKIRWFQWQNRKENNYNEDEEVKACNHQ